MLRQSSSAHTSKQVHLGVHGVHSDSADEVVKLHQTRLHLLCNGLRCNKAVTMSFVMLTDVTSPSA